MTWTKWLMDEIKDWIVWIAIAVILSFIIGTILSAAFGSATPLVAVMSTSMLHDDSISADYYNWMAAKGFTREELDRFPFPNGFNKGDVLVVVGASPTELSIGDVVVFNAPAQSYPIIHRVIEIKSENNQTIYVTKGDNNPAPDRWITPHSAIKGKAVFWVPILGYVKVIPLDLCRAIEPCKRTFKV